MPKLGPAPRDPGSLASMRADGGRVGIHPADVRGRFARARKLGFAVLVAIYLALPLVHSGGHPLVHLDVAARRFYLFGGTFNAQDFWLVLFLVTTSAFGLLFASAWLGRAWCGWACPQTVFLEGVFRPIERLFDGPRERRLKRAASPWTALGVVRSLAKHATYLAAAFALSHVALGLFVSMPTLWTMIREGPSGHQVAFAWASSVTLLTYFNFAWFREQLCILVCPYGRLQSVLTDRGSLTIGYDAARGEPRGRLVKASAAARGDCVDCLRCVQVCPTGIDIRQGPQMECLACTACVDACDEVMVKVGLPRGLIRYDTQARLEGERATSFRPRLWGYGVLLAASAAALVASLALRSPFEANLFRARGTSWVADGAMVRNQFELHLINKHPGPATFEVSVQGPLALQVVLPQRQLELGSLQGHRLPIFASISRNAFREPFLLTVHVHDRLSGTERVIEARFLGPNG